MTTNVEHIFMYLSTICIFSFVKLKSVAYILNFFFLLSCVHFSYLSDTTPSSDICVKNIFSPSGLPMNLLKRIFLWAEVFIISEVNCFYVFRLWNIGHSKVAKIFCVFERILWFSVGLLSIVSSFWHVICHRGHIDFFFPMKQIPFYCWCNKPPQTQRLPRTRICCQSSRGKESEMCFAGLIARRWPRRMSAAALGTAMPSAALRGGQHASTPAPPTQPFPSSWRPPLWLCPFASFVHGHLWFRGACPDGPGSSSHLKNRI